MTARIFVRACSALILFLLGVHFAFATSAEFSVGVTVEGCNANLVCEPGLGENPSTCSADCTTFQCSNGIDDDSDGQIDFPNDPQCDSLLDDTEADGGGSGGSGPQPLCSITIVPDSISLGETATLVWDSTYASLSREIVPALGTVAVEGSIVIAPTVDTTYTGTFVGLRGSTFCSDTITVDTGPAVGVVRFVEDSYVAPESDGVVTIPVRREGGGAGEISVEVLLSPGSASEADYVINPIILTWADGETGIKTFDITLVEDVFVESLETFTAEIKSIPRSARGDPHVATIAIVDSTEPVEDVGYITLIKEVINNNSGTKSPSGFVLLLEGQQIISGQTVTVDAGEAYELDEMTDPDYALVSVSGSALCPSRLPGAVTLNPGQIVTCVIANDDRPFLEQSGRIQFSSNTYQVIEGGVVRVVVRRVDGSRGLVKVRVLSVMGTANAPEDYVALSTELSWNDGEAGDKTLLIATTDDRLVEGSESFSLSLESVEGGLGNPDVATLVILDNDGPDETCVGDECYTLGVPPTITPDSPLQRLVIPVIDSIQDNEDIYRSPEARQIARIGSGLGALGGAVSLLSVGFGIQNLWWSLLRLVTLLLSAIGLRRNVRPWGIVYDSVTKQPIDPAYVALIDAQGKEVASAITDLDGRYGFLVKPGTYWLIAKKTHYIFPSVRLRGREPDELYDNLYFGESIDITEEHQVITKNIPLDPIGFDWNEFKKRDMKVMRYYRRRDKFVTQLIEGLFLAGFLLTFVVFLYSPNAYNYLVLLVYVGMVLMRLLGLRRCRSGVITRADTQDPYPFAILRVYSAATHQEAGHAVTDRAGRYCKLINNGTYYLRIFEKVTEEGFRLIHTSDKFTIRRGILNKNFKVPKPEKPL